MTMVITAFQDPLCHLMKDLRPTPGFSFRRAANSNVFIPCGKWLQAWLITQILLFWNNGCIPGFTGK